MRVTHTTFLALVAALGAQILSPPREAHAQALLAPPPAKVDRPFSRPCHAAMADLDGFKATLTAFEKMRLRFREKADTGYYGDAKGKAREWFDALAPAQTIATVAKYLEELGDTFALVYDAGVFDNQHSICIWLLSANGIEAAVTVPLPNWQMPPFVHAALRVDAREAKRARRTRLGGVGKRLAKCPDPEPTGDLTPEWLLSEQQTQLASQALKQVAEVLLPKEIRARLTEKVDSRILILPALDLGTVPFAALPIDEHRMLVDVASVVVLANVEGLYKGQALGLWTKSSQDRAGSLILGDPDLSQDPHFCFAPLPHAKSEAEFAAELFSVPPLLGGDASISAIKKWFGSNVYSTYMLYFATHGVADADNPMDASFLAAKDGNLYGRDILALRFPRSPLVVMSACQSGLGKVFEGGVFGLARAWHFAGAPQVVMSLWNVDDLATRMLMQSFLAYVSQGIRAESALRRAMLELRDHEKAEHRMSDPALWASFALFGLPTPKRDHGMSVRARP